MGLKNDDMNTVSIDVMIECLKREKEKGITELKFSGTIGSVEPTCLSILYTTEPQW